jgi:citrate lyase subunit beta/citryl-CoA lyase
VRTGDLGGKANTKQFTQAYRAARSRRSMVRSQFGLRSKLFVPGFRPELFAKAMAGEADALSFDLEDAVDESRKDEARRELAAFLRTLPRNIGKDHHRARERPRHAALRARPGGDRGPGLDIVNLPKPEVGRRRARVRRGAREGRARSSVDPVDILPNIESPRALRLAAEIATASPRVVGLQAGWGDLIEPLDIDRYNRR